MVVTDQGRVIGIAKNGQIGAPWGLGGKFPIDFPKSLDYVYTHVRTAEVPSSVRQSRSTKLWVMIETTTCSAGTDRPSLADPGDQQYQDDQVYLGLEATEDRATCSAG